MKCRLLRSVFPGAWASVTRLCSANTAERIAVLLGVETPGDKRNIAGQLPDKFSAADRLPTSTLKQTVDRLASFIAEVFNRLLVRGHFTAAFKKAFITPTLKNPDMDTTDVSSYRPISNLPLLSKLLQRLVVRQLIDYLQSTDLLPVNHCGFRPGHSTETAVLRVSSDILLAVDRGEVAALIVLDLSAAFDTVDY